jgi:hypothetical protein
MLGSHLTPAPGIDRGKYRCSVLYRTVGCPDTQIGIAEGHPPPSKRNETPVPVILRGCKPPVKDATGTPISETPVPAGIAGRGFYCTIFQYESLRITLPSRNV